MINKNLNSGDKVTFISEKFGYDNIKDRWFVLENNNNCIRLEYDDSHKLTLDPPRGKYIVHIDKKFINSVRIKKVKK